MTDPKPAFTREEVNSSINQAIFVLVLCSFVTGIGAGTIIAPYGLLSWIFQIAGFAFLLLVPLSIRTIKDEILYLEIKAGRHEG